MKRTLRRELKVPEIAEREANGTSQTWQDCRMPAGLLVASTQVWQRVLNVTCVVFLALPVNISSRLRKTSGKW